MECTPLGIACWFYPAVAMYLDACDISNLMRTCQTIYDALTAHEPMWRALMKRDFQMTLIIDVLSARARYWEVSRYQATLCAEELMLTGFRGMIHSTPTTGMLIQDALVIAMHPAMGCFIRPGLMHPAWRRLPRGILKIATKKLVRIGTLRRMSKNRYKYLGYI